MLSWPMLALGTLHPRSLDRHHEQSQAWPSLRATDTYLLKSSARVGCSSISMLSWPMLALGTLDLAKHHSHTQCIIHSAAVTHLLNSSARVS